MDTPVKRWGRVATIIIGALLTAIIAWIVFVFGPQGNLTVLLGILLVVIAAVLGARVSSDIAERVFGVYNVGKVSVEGPITREGGRSIPSRPTATPADDIVSQIENADDDENVNGLIVHLNTPGGEVVPSDDIRNAVLDFEGPTVAYATDTCASGGYWIASGCDSIISREGSLIGSIGVLASRATAGKLLDELGITYERLVAGDYKDTGVPLRDMEEDDREYLQGLVDGYYETFIERVIEGRDIDAETVRDTEARAYLGSDAKEIGLIDDLGTIDDVHDYLESTLETPVEVKEFEPPKRVRAMLQGGAASFAFALGAGITSGLADSEERSLSNIRLR